jgi:pyruvate carboxylase
MNHQQALATAITLTGEILEVLDDGEFDRVSDLESKRKVYVEHAFRESIETIDLIKAQHLQNLNQQVVDKLNLFKQSIISQQASIRTASKATQAYLNHDSGPK